ncbi:MAG TPA: VOC family protein [Burkholderiales bacterium]|nr:VOC family protein [Burkholderiales bacterium]
MMIEPYLFFDGRAEEAIEFYKSALGAKVVAVIRYKENPQPQHNPPGSDEKVMHSLLRFGDSGVMISDGKCGGHPAFQGFALTLQASDEADAKRRFEALSKGGQVQMPLGETFFARSFGMVADKFGVSWMVIAGTKEPGK